MISGSASLISSCLRVTKCVIAWRHWGVFQTGGIMKLQAIPSSICVPRPPPPPRLFDNGRLTVIYNPHCSPRLSSFHRLGMEVLEYFYHSEKFNLVFAPHIMLFERRWKNRARRLPARYKTCPHMIIDTGSHRSSDMSYTLFSDLYIGDVSSQVYEFLIRPRPCIFLNPQNTPWRHNPYYYHWRLGPVVNDINSLDAALKTAWQTHDTYREKQQDAFAYTFDLMQTTSSLRAANAIVNFLRRAKRHGGHGR